MITNTETMNYDALTEMYVLTEDALTNSGINLRGRLASNKAATPEYIVKEFLQTVSEMIYGYIYDNSLNVVSKIDSNTVTRHLFERALIKQAIYILSVGNLSLSVDENKRAIAIDTVAKSLLKMISDKEVA
ncbi:MAG: hypothetical protein II984_03615 [Clostridia bacterium]|nr:hypothetical protein [Clostridia bacterium]